MMMTRMNPMPSVLSRTPSKEKKSKCFEKCSCMRRALTGCPGLGVNGYEAWTLMFLRFWDGDGYCSAEF